MAAKEPGGLPAVAFCILGAAIGETGLRTTKKGSILQLCMQEYTIDDTHDNPINVRPATGRTNPAACFMTAPGIPAASGPCDPRDVTNLAPAR